MKIKRLFSGKAGAYFLLTLGIITLGCSSIIVKKTEAPGPIIAFYRFFFSSIILTPILFAENRKKGQIARRETIGWKKYLFPLCAGVVNAMDYALTMIGMKITSIASATLLNNVAPLWVGLISWLIYRKKLGKKYWFGLGLALFGAVIVLGNDFIFHPHLGRGDIYALVGSLFYASYFLISEKGSRYFSAMEYYAVTLYSSAVCLLAINLLMKNSLTNYSAKTWALFLIAAIFCQLIGQFSVTASLRILPANLVSTTMLFQPVLSAMLAIPFLHEGLAPLQWAGGAATLLGVYLVNRDGASRNA